MTLPAGGPCIVQSDLTVLLEVSHPAYEQARDALSRFAELVKSPELMHTYRITPLSLWNAAAAGCTGDWILERLEAFSRYPLPGLLRRQVADLLARYGKLVLRQDGADLVLESAEHALLSRVEKTDGLAPCLRGRRGEALLVDPLARGRLKNGLIKLGLPVRDLAGYAPGAPFSLRLLPATRSGRPFELRPYQRQAVDAFLGAPGAAGGPAGRSPAAPGPGGPGESFRMPALAAMGVAGPAPEGGSGVVVLACGAGKTVVGMAAMSRLACRTLILGANITALRQWRAELLDKTDIKEEDIGEYSGERKEIRPVTLATYQIVTRQAPDTLQHPHYPVFDSQDWGLIIYDEVHMLPAPVFQITASLQARRRLGLTATLLREDGKEDDVFSLIGPKRFDLPWKLLEDQGWIAAVDCCEVRVPFPEADLIAYLEEEREAGRFRAAAENPEKLAVVRGLLARHAADRILIIGQYLDQLKRLSAELEIPLLTGASSNRTRERCYREFRGGGLTRLIVSSIGNVAVDLPDANCAIQVSGRFGSRQEEAQRLGRILRPKRGANKAAFYTLVTQDTEEQLYARHRQLFLTEQGYRYAIVPAAALFPRLALLPPPAGPPAQDACPHLAEEAAAPVP